MSLTTALQRMLTYEVAAWPLAWCRIGVGLAATIRGLKSIRDLYLLQHDPFTVPARLYDWTPRMAATWEIALFGVVWLLACAGLMLGVCARLCALVLFALSILLQVVDQNFWGHHVYFLTLLLLLLAWSDSGATLSPRWAREGGHERWVEGWPVWLLKVQLSLAYFFTAVAKLNPAFLTGEVYIDRVSLPGPLLVQPMVSILAVGTVALEFFLAFGFWHARMRRWALLSGVLLHGLVPVVMGPYAGLLVFTLAVFSVYALFLDDRQRLPDRAMLTP